MEEVFWDSALLVKIKRVFRGSAPPLHGTYARLDKFLAMHLPKAKTQKIHFINFSENQGILEFLIVSFQSNDFLRTQRCIQLGMILSYYFYSEKITFVRFKDQRFACAIFYSSKP